MRRNDSIYLKFWLISAVIWFSNATLYGQTSGTSKTDRYEQLKLAHEYARSMNAKLNAAFEKSKSFKDMKANWDMILKSDPAKMEGLVKEFYAKYSTQIAKAKSDANYNEKAIGKRMREMLLGSGYTVIVGEGGFMTLNEFLATGAQLPAIQTCIDYNLNDATDVDYVGPPEIPDFRKLLITTGGPFDPRIGDGTGEGGSGSNYMVNDFDVWNESYGLGFGKSIKIKVPSSYPCAEIRVTSTMELKFFDLGIIAHIPTAPGEVTNIACVRIFPNLLRRGDLLNNEGEFFMTYLYSTFHDIYRAVSSASNDNYNFGLWSRRLDSQVRARSGDEVEILFQVGGHVRNNPQIFPTPIIGANLSKSAIRNIRVSMCKCE